MLALAVQKDFFYSRGQLNLFYCTVLYLAYVLTVCVCTCAIPVTEIGTPWPEFTWLLVTARVMVFRPNLKGVKDKILVQL